ncbi:MAG: S9 family peptidase [Anaerococcus sp.]|nr:S9 family peptidase [Anaerococcus sp.]
MEKTQLKDILTYDFLSELNISDDESLLSYKKTRANEKENRYDSNFYLYDTKSNETYQVSEDNKASISTFTKDNKFIFKKESTDEADVFYINDNPGLPRKFMEIKKNVSFIKALDATTYFIEASEKKSKEEIQKEKDQAFFEEVTRLPFYSNGEGYVKENYSSFYLYNKEEDKLDLLLETDSNNRLYLSDVDPINKKALFIRYNSNENMVDEFRDDIVLLDFETKETKTLVEKSFATYTANFLEDKIIFVGTDMNKHGINEDAFIYSLDFDGKYKKIVDSDFDMAFFNSVGTDARFGGARSFDVKNNRFYFVVTDFEESKLYSINLKGDLRCEIESGVEDFALGENNIYYFEIGRDHLAELRRKGSSDVLIENKVSTFVAPIETFDFKSNEDKLTGYVVLPKDFDEGKKYPTLLSVHGGPKTEFSDIFHHEHQMFASDGYIIIYTNPHGSSGRGVDFSDIRGHYGDTDYDDLMRFVDLAIEKYPQIDVNRLGVYGGSYGGFMTNFIIGHTNRFKAAVSQRSISNWTSFYGVSDIGYYFATDQTDADIWDSFDKLWDQSPIKYAKNVTTPTLFIHSDEDYRCPLEQGLQMYTRIKLNGVDTKMYIFHGENHELSRSGRPKGRLKRLSEIKAWFDKYLKDEN